MGRVYEPVSLGAACETKFQISRKLYREFYQGKSELGFRIEMKPPTWGQRNYKMQLFDWQDTPFETLCTMLECDFEGLFERDDLIAHPEGVFHKTLGINYRHLFGAYEARLTPDAIDRAYSGARARFERQARGFRNLLREPGPFLYIFAAADPMKGSQEELFPMPSPTMIERLVELLGARSTLHEFHLLILGPEYHPAEYVNLSDRVTIGLRPKTSTKARMLAWEGDDAGWDAALAGYQFLLHNSIASAPSHALEGPPEPSHVVHRL